MGWNTSFGRMEINEEKWNAKFEMNYYPRGRMQYPRERIEYLQGKLEYLRGRLENPRGML
jgi:hypothetical protein